MTARALTIVGVVAAALAGPVTLRAQRQGGPPPAARESAPVWAAIDEEKLRRTLLNLLTNAHDAVNGNGRIEIELTSTGPDVEIRVSDNGPGLSTEAQKKIFEPFFTTKEKGTGLGLAIAKKIIEGHGGRITVSSTEGQGTTFTLVFPRQRPDAKVAA